MKKLAKIVKVSETIDKLEKDLVEMFNNFTELYSGELFEKTKSDICKYCKPTSQEEELFMNFLCNHPEGDGNCCILSCPDAKKKTQVAGTISNVQEELVNANLVLINELFNKLNIKCKHHKGGRCNNKKNRHVFCTAAYCPI